MVVIIKNEFFSGNGKLIANAFHLPKAKIGSICTVPLKVEHLQRHKMLSPMKRGFITGIFLRLHLMVTSLTEIAVLAAQKEIENQSFQQFLKQEYGEEVDKIVHQLDEAIAPQIDCTACGNCCKTLMINVTNEEAEVLSAHLSQTREVFDKQYLEKGSSLMVINKIPCHFLENNKCTVYNHRFAGCREFPGLHLPGFTKRLFTIFMHYDRCPIIFNIVEELKVKLVGWK